MDSKPEDKTQEKRISSIIFSRSYASPSLYWSSPLILHLSLYLRQRYIRGSDDLESSGPDQGSGRKSPHYELKLTGCIFSRKTCPHYPLPFFCRRNSDRLRTTGETPTQKKVSFTAGKDPTTNNRSPSERKH